MTLDEYTAPECQMRSCSSDADETREHPDHGQIQVCDACARLFGGESDE